MIFTYSEAPDPHLNDQAWAAAFVLISFVLILSLLSARAAVAQPPQARARLARCVHQIAFTKAFTERMPTRASTGATLARVGADPPGEREA